MGNEIQKTLGKPVQVSRLGKQYGTVVAVDDISLDVASGEFLSLLGPSGSGKTTLLMMIAGFEHPTSGTIAVGSQDFTYTPPNKRGIGMVFQKYALFPHMTVAENIGFPLKMRKLGKPATSVKIEQALAMVRLSGYGDRTPAQLSGGQQQRIAVARALVFEPPVLLMDEPLGALDKKLREEMQIEIKAIQERLGVTVIYVTHDQEEALTMSDRVAVMNHGKIVQIGTPTSLYRNPANPFVADFIGKMNFIEAKILRKDGNAIGLEVGEGTIVEVPVEQAVDILAWNVGLAVQLAARPEQIQLEVGGSRAGSSIPGEVEASIFVGSHHVVLVRLKGTKGASIQVRFPDSSKRAFHRGEAVDVVLDATTTKLFPAKAGS